MLAANRVGRTSKANGAFLTADGSAGAGVFAVLQQNRFHAWVALENANQLRAAVAPVSDNSNPGVHLD